MSTYDFADPTRPSNTGKPSVIISHTAASATPTVQIQLAGFSSGQEKNLERIAVKLCAAAASGNAKTCNDLLARLGKAGLPDAEVDRARGILAAIHTT
ncbi:hypothetical protein [Amycolatopsis sp. RTGN1]|uniref:hypothetical protein n=1 Tax=Amycolatopsis ponsaeliensis TaxID=2992142 RepID=UPI00254CAAAB|nr:hypothetical protein [Amycolatopsis sp. RTGN1]